jgi:hypothetical protein
MAKWLMQKGIVPPAQPERGLIMKTLLTIAALAAAALASSGANAETVHRHHRAGAGMVHHASAPMPAPTSFQGLYQADGASNECEGQRVFGFCNVR